MEIFKKRNIVLVLLLIVIILGLWLLWLRPIEKKPEEVGMEYQRGFMEMKLDQAYEMLSQEDKKNIIKEEFNKVFFGERVPYFGALRNEIVSSLKYKVINKQISKDRAVIRYELELPDFRDKMDVLFKIVFSNRPEKEKLSLLSEEFKNLIRGGHLPRKRWVRVINLKREKGSWRIYLGWAETLRYRDEKIKIENLNTVWGKDAFGRAQIVIQGVVVNNGDNTIGRMALNIKFLDKYGLPIYTQEIYPVAMEGDWGEHQMLLPHAQKEFFDIVRPVPLRWGGRIVYEVTSLIFE